MVYGRLQVKSPALDLPLVEQPVKHVKLLLDLLVIEILILKPL